ncbi:hypothetical protein [Pseudomonas mosselii]|uniref:hypothetical protein n=1 Tax=Pseudomonas mosselii TaxID=78327 RepID=UPI0021DB4AD5|nr:hypothetical protein [Pseudomonas mosselii]MCU9527554.1 hypothetical protein [Pseudomonas mosselii]MCU9534867.1 hypothetical protein [Pseudomonas mosselii]MCU9542370.1 hypothetical protein [Pseudomonas mosselii]MCU9546707.1 hypothetical protein [Pseudomonas mosselii]
MPSVTEIKSTLAAAGFKMPDMSPVAETNIVKTAGLCGFSKVHTGGGCMALRRDAGDFYIMLTDEGGSDLPDEQDWEQNLIGIYRETDEGDEEVICMSAREFLDLINADKLNSGSQG